MPLNKLAKTCTAKSKRSGNLCRNPAMENGKCRMHGGKSLKGFASSNFITGRHSKYLNHLPESKRERFDELLTLNEIPSLMENIALNDENLRETFELLDDSTMLERWNNLKAAFKLARLVILEPHKLTDLQKSTLTPEIVLDNINEILNAESNNTKVWNRINDLNERSRKLQLSESKIRLNNIEKSIKDNTYAPVEWVRRIVRDLSEIFELAPEEVRRDQLRMLQMKYNALPETVKNGNKTPQEFEDEIN